MILRTLSNSLSMRRWIVCQFLVLLLTRRTTPDGASWWSSWIRFLWQLLFSFHCQFQWQSNYSIGDTNDQDITEINTKSHVRNRLSYFTGKSTHVFYWDFPTSAHLRGSWILKGQEGGPDFFSREDRALVSQWSYLAISDLASSHDQTMYDV